jgi:hypothetical protein
VNHPATHPQAPQIVDALLMNDYTCTFGADPCPKNLAATMQTMAPSRVLLREVKNMIMKTAAARPIAAIKFFKTKDMSRFKIKECRCLNTAQAEALESKAPPWL